jgi:hypothetical protein
MSLNLYLEYHNKLDKDEHTCSRCGAPREDRTVYDTNITHNLNQMARAVSEKFYKSLWRPEEVNNCYHAADFIPALEAGLAELKANPEKYEAYNDPGGWGLYKHFVPFVEKYLAACRQYPSAVPRASR